MIGLDTVYIIVSICVFVWLFSIKNKKINLEYIKRTLGFTLPIIPHLLSQMVLTQCDLLMISYYTGSSNTGIYSMAHTVGFLAFTMMSQIMAVWSPWHLRRLEENDCKVVKPSSNIMVLLGFYMTIGLLTIEPELITWFLNDSYLPCIYIIPPLALAMYFQFIYLFFYNVEYYYELAKKIATASIIAAILNLLLNMYFIPKFGYVAAGYTTVTSYAVLLMLNLIFCKNYRFEEMFDIKLMIGSCVLVVFYIIFIFVSVKSMILRYLAFVIITIILILFKGKELLTTYKSMK